MTPEPNTSPNAEPAKSATPRTDDAAHRYFDSRRYNRKAPAVYAKDMAALEQDLAQARAELAEISKRKDCECGWAAADEWESQCNQARDTIKVLREALENPDWTDLWKQLNYFASGESQNQFARVEPLAVLGDLYQRLAIIHLANQAALASTQEDAP